MDGAGARETPHAAMAGESSGNEVTATYEITDDELQAAEVELQQRKLEAIKLNAMRAAADAERQSAIEQAMRKKAEQQQRVHEERVRRVNEEQFEALRNDDKDRLIRLLEGGTDVNYAGKLKRTPLHICVMLDKPKLLQVLLRYRANPEAEDIYMQTPFSLAIKYNRSRCFELMSLSSKGAGRHLYQRNLMQDIARHKVDVEQRRIQREEEKRQAMIAEAARKSRLERAKMLGYAVDADGNRI